MHTAAMMGNGMRKACCPPAEEGSHKEKTDSAFWKWLTSASFYIHPLKQLPHETRERLELPTQLTAETKKENASGLVILSSVQDIVRCLFQAGCLQPSQWKSAVDSQVIEPSLTPYRTVLAREREKKKPINLFSWEKTSMNTDDLYLQSLVQVGWRNPTLPGRAGFGRFGPDQPFQRMSRVQDFHVLTFLKGDGFTIGTHGYVVSSHHIDVKNLQTWTCGLILKTGYWDGKIH